MRVQQLFIVGITLLCCHCKSPQQAKVQTAAEKTAFQTGSPWRPEIDVRSDIAIVYGANDRKNLSFTDRLNSWREHQYTTQFMTGMAWGDYIDFYSGKWDGTDHRDIAQLEQNGTRIMHGEDNPYVVPDSSFIAYMKMAVVKKVIDAGVSTIYLEEPEFWARGGYSEHFKKAWRAYYGFPWKAQDESIENTYLSNKLKYHLYYKAIEEVSSFAKSYGKSKGMAVNVFIPTHSLINYSSWEIVSPEASLASLPSIDGYIAQVCTGTSRTPNYFNGQKAERVFENAFLEYGCMISMTAPTNRKVFLLTDPIEDGVRDWADYKRNYEATYTAKMLYPTVDNYEVMPWPERIYTHPYKLTDSDSAVMIPRFYSTQMQIMVNTENAMPLSANQIDGAQGIGVLMSNSLMFQRFPAHEGYDDPLFSNFFGQVLPLEKRGIPVQIIHMENLGFPQCLKDIKILVLSYSNMKPMEEKSHEQLADWVKKGGTLVYCGQDDDPYQNVMEWWNTKGNNFKTPAEHLFKLMDLKPTGTQSDYRVEAGHVYILKTDPKHFVMQKNGDQNYVQTISKAYADAFGKPLKFKNHFYLQRGPYDIVSVMTESINDQAFRVQGPVIDLFDPKLPVLTEKNIEPGTQSLLYNLNRIADKNNPQVLASAARIYKEEKKNDAYSFIAKSPVNTTNSMRILLPDKPENINLTDMQNEAIKLINSSWDEQSKTCFLSFDNSPDGINVKISW